MDPNEALATLRRMAKEADENNGDGTLLDFTFHNILEVFTGLDGWLTKQGFLPNDWARTDRPLVLVIETPDEDPSIYTHGDVELWEDSAYPTTHYAADEIEQYTDYPFNERTLANEAEARGATEVAAALRGLADDFEAAWGEQPTSTQP